MSDVDEELAERAKARVGQTLRGNCRTERVVGVDGMEEVPEGAVALVTELFERQSAEELWLTRAAAR